MDTQGKLYSEDGALLGDDDDGGIDRNFSLKYSLSAGQTVYLEVKLYSSYDSGTVTVGVQSDNAKQVSNNTEFELNGLKMKVIEYTINYSRTFTDKQYTWVRKVANGYKTIYCRVYVTNNQADILSAELPTVQLMVGDDVYDTCCTYGVENDNVNTINNWEYGTASIRSGKTTKVYYIIDIPESYQGRSDMKLCFLDSNGIVKYYYNVR